MREGEGVEEVSGGVRQAQVSESVELGSVGNHFEGSGVIWWHNQIFVFNRSKLGGRDYCHRDLGGDSSNSSGYTLKVLRRENGQAGVVLLPNPSIGELWAKGWNATDTAFLDQATGSQRPRVPKEVDPLLDYTQCRTCFPQWFEMRMRFPGWIDAQEKCKRNLRFPCIWLSSISLL